MKSLVSREDRELLRDVADSLNATAAAGRRAGAQHSITQLLENYALAKEVGLTEIAEVIKAKLLNLHGLRVPDPSARGSKVVKLHQKRGRKT